MIRGMHGLFYSSKAEATREFMRDKLKLPYSDIGDGWLIFDLPEADIGVHPTDASGQTPSGTHDVSFFCDDIEGTVADLRRRNVPFTSPIEDHGYGLVTHFTAPGGIRIQLYQPRYTKGTSRSRPKPPARRASPARKAKRPAARKRRL